MSASMKLYQYFITFSTYDLSFFDVSVTVHRCYNNINNQLEAKITVY